jgi:hypothetical protein
MKSDVNLGRVEGGPASFCRPGFPEIATGKPDRTANARRPGIPPGVDWCILEASRCALNSFDALPVARADDMRQFREPSTANLSA